MEKETSLPDWVEDLINETRRDIEIGLDHHANNAPGRIRIAHIALDRLIRTVKRLAKNRT